MKTTILQFSLIFLIPLAISAQWVGDPSENSVIQSNTDWCALPKVVSAENGDTYISWFTGVALNFNVYLQRLNTNGEKYWDDYGLLVSDNPTMTWVTDYDLKIDNQNNAIIVNQDKRTGSNNAFAYKISPEGEFLWGENGINLSDTLVDLCASPKAMVTNENDVIFLWEQVPFDTVNNTVKIGMQKVSSEGIVQWGDGLFISDTLHYFMPTLIKTDNNDFLASWLSSPQVDDVIPGQPIYMKVYAQKFDMDGNAVWQNPVRIDTGNLLLYNGLYTFPKLIPDEEGGSFVCWKTFLDDAVTNFLQHIDSDGNLLWNAPTNVSTNTVDHHSDGGWIYDPSVKEIFIFWQEYHEDLVNMIDCFGVFGQKLSNNGERLWGDEGKVFVDLNCTMDTVYYNVFVEKSNENDALVLYAKEYFEILGQDTSFNTELYAMRVNHAGAFIWDNEIINVSTAYGEKGRMVAGNYANGQWITAWEDTRNTLNEMEPDIYAQNIQLDGNLGPVGIHNHNSNSINEISNYPNPFTCNTTVSLTLAKNCSIKMALYDIDGRLIKIVYEGDLSSGKNSVNINGSFLQQGIYLLKCETGNYCFYHKMAVVR